MRKSLVLIAAACTLQAQNMLIRNVTVLTVTKGTVANGSVLVENGKISAVGKDISAPAGATVIDGSGKFLMPGIIDCHSHTAIEGGVNEGSVSDSSMVNIKDVLKPERHQYLSRPVGWIDRIECVARQCECNWRADDCGEASLGQGCAADDFRGARSPASSSRWVRTLSVRAIRRRDLV